MGEATRQAHEAVVRARTALRGEVDELGSATRSALDIPAKVRENPVQTVGLATGAVFLAVGGPKRILQAAETRLRRGKKRRDRPKGILPKEIDRTVKSLGDDEAVVREKLEREFAHYIREKAKTGKLEPSGRQSMWRLFDVIAVPLGAQVSRRFAERLLAADPDRPPVATEPAIGREALAEDAAVIAAQSEDSV
ncbi:MAG: hypothetical protein H0X16_03150 [Chloroflexi bacterium]|nr:hypothetical protein [Chloroflexota bacterium]